MSLPPAAGLPWQNPLHDVAGAQQAVPAGNPNRRDIPYPFVVDHVGPARLPDIVNPQLHRQIPQWNG